MISSFFPKEILTARLKEECKSQGLQVTGTKAVLVQRLTDNGAAPTEKKEEKMEVEEKTKKSTSTKRKADDEPDATPPDSKKKKVFA
jgi:hypothetical protein